MHQDDMNGSEPVEIKASAEENQEENAIENQEEAVHQETPEINENSETTSEPLAENAAPLAEEASESEAPAAEEESETSESPEAEPVAETSSGEEAAEEPTAETPASEDVSDSEEVSAEETAPEEEAKPRELSPEDKVFLELISNEKAFEKHVQEANLIELLFIMEKALQAEDIGPLISKVKLVKKEFDKLKKENEDSEQDAQAYGKFSLALSRFNRRRQEYVQKLEEEREENSKKKQELLDRLKAIVEEEKVQNIQAVRDIQNEWKNTGYILQKDVMPFNTMYKYYLDIYYNLRGQYQELMDTDRKYNLEEKQKIIEEIVSMIPDGETQSRDSWREATDKVRSLQDFWKTVGPVPKEDLEENNAAYRGALDKFFSGRTEFFGSLDAERKENAEKKRKLLEELAPYESYTSDLAKDWNQATKRILALQEKWNKVGPAGSDDNKILWKAYRNVCNTFFKNKSGYFKKFDDDRNQNLELKMAIVAKAEALKESENFKEASEELKRLQQEWKQIGPVHDRHSNRIWKQFRAACDHFFSRRDGSANSGREAEGKNLEAKLELIKKLGEINSRDEFDEGTLQEFQKIQEEWKAIGHVPFRQKDDVNEGFRKAMDEFFKKAEVSKDLARKMKVESKMNLIVDDDMRVRRIKSDLNKYRHKIREAEEKIDAYETNVLYIAKGKKGDPLRKQIQSQIEKEREKVASLKKKMKSLREMMENPEGAKKGKSDHDDSSEEE